MWQQQNWVQMLTVQIADKGQNMDFFSQSLQVTYS